MNPPLYSFLLLMMLFADLFAFNGTVGGQGRHGDVMVTVTSEKIIALPASGGAIEEGLAANEAVGKTVARGQTGFAQTSARLLGFSTELRRWTEVQLSANEPVERYQVLPRLIVVQTTRQLYGFQEGRGHWTSEPLGANEQAKQLHGRGHVCRDGGHAVCGDAFGLLYTGAARGPRRPINCVTVRIDRVPQ